MIRQGHEWFIAKIKDMTALCQRRQQPVTTGFLTLAEQEIVKTLAGNQLTLQMNGGYEDAERKIARLSPYPCQAPNVCVLTARYDGRFGKALTHKDILGALMHLGIERETIGDLLVMEEWLYIFCTEGMADYIASSLTQIGRHSVSFSEGEVGEPLRIMREQITVNVAGLRLDAVVAALAHCSRAKAKAMLKQGLVKVNDVVLDENRQMCNNDFVSIRKIGRFRFLDVVSTTRKDRFVLRFEKYM